MLPSVTRNELLAKAFEKHSRFNSNFVYGDSSEYRLLYPTMNQVVNLPGTEEPFTLQRYKQEIDKPYCRITFFLCSSTDYFENLMNDTCDDDEDLPSVSTLRKPNSSADASSRSVPILSEEDTRENCTSSPSTSSGTIQCPICLDKYALGEIESHADSCSMWLLGDIDELPPNQTPTSSGSVMPIASVENILPNDLKEVIKQEITRVVAAEMSNEDPKRLTVRRKFIWQDFKNARQRNISPKQKVKVIFSGEPSVDEGGPRRELFSGTLNNVFFEIGLLVN